MGARDISRKAGWEGRHAVSWTLWEIGEGAEELKSVWGEVIGMKQEMRVKTWWRVLQLCMQPLGIGPSAKWSGGAKADQAVEQSSLMGSNQRDVGRMETLLKSQSSGRAHVTKAAGFPVKAYTHDELHSAFDAIKKHWSDTDIRVGPFNAASGVWKGFLETTPEKIQEAVNVDVVDAFAFARETILVFKDLPTYLSFVICKHTHVAWKARHAPFMHGRLPAGKFSIRALSQRLNKEFRKQDIHVAHSVIDGQIFNGMLEARFDEACAEDEAVRLNPGSIANAYLYLANQDHPAWRWELDSRCFAFMLRAFLWMNKISTTYTSFAFTQDV
ncbi:hypothetical protein JB92DRAFT_2836857 [Gautieria morchelliformis]|nr:hypothetical protein JB92DRAFT_2836857 [Gautieria morchelliformis]